MHPYLNAQAYKLLAETLAESEAQDRANDPEWSRHLLHGLGGMLVAVGQKLQTTGDDVRATLEHAGYPALDDEVCIS
jgi:hypothetical protein